MFLQQLRYSLLFSLLTNYAIAAATADTCAMFTPTSFSDEGFWMTTYNLPANENNDKIADELYSYLVDATSAGGVSRTNFYDIGFNISIPAGTEYSGSLYPGQAPILLSSFAAVFSAGLKPKETGEYTFSFDGVHDGAAMFILHNQDPLCCENLANGMTLADYTNFYYIPDDPNYQTKSMTFYLKADTYYYFYLSYINHDGDAIFVPTMTTPSGEVITNFKGYIYGTDEHECSLGNSTSSTVSGWTETYATTYSTSVITNVNTVPGLDIPYTEVETTYYIMTPIPESSTSLVISSSSEVVTSSSSSSFVPSMVSSSLSEYSSTRSSVLLSSTEQTSTASSDDESTISSTMSSAAESSSITPSSSISSIISSDGGTSITQSTIMSSVSSSVVSSEAVLSSQTVSENLDTETSSKNTDSTTSSASTAYVSDSTADSSSFIYSNQHSNTNSISNETPSESSTLFISSKTTQLISPSDNSGESQKSETTDSISTSTYTDIYGMTRTTTVKCSTNVCDKKSTQGADSVSHTVVTVTTTTIRNDGNTYVSVITRTVPVGYAETDKITNPAQTNEQETITFVEHNSESSVQVQLQSNSGTSSTTHIVQQAGNAADKSKFDLFFYVIAIVSPLFFI